MKIRLFNFLTSFLSPGWYICLVLLTAGSQSFEITVYGTCCPFIRLRLVVVTLSPGFHCFGKFTDLLV